MARPVPRLSPEEIQRVIATAWDDRPPFDEVLRRHGLNPGQVVALLRRELTPSAFKVWAARSGQAGSSGPRRVARPMRR